MKLAGLAHQKKSLLLFIIIVSLFSLVAAQSAITHPLGDIEVPSEEETSLIKYKGSRNYKFTERSDLRVYQNGKYIGLQSKLVSAYIIPYRNNDGLVYEGSFFVDQDTNRNKAQVGSGLHEAIDSSFIINEDGNLTMLLDNGYPTFRSFPAFSSRKIKKGDSWEAKAMRAVDPLSKGIVTKMPIYVRYTYTGDDFYNGEEVYLISAQWATRYGTGGTTTYVDWGGDKALDYAQGSHKADIIVSKKTGAAFVVRDTVDETFVYKDGNKYQYKGTISLFTEYPPAVDRSKLIAALKKIAELDEDEVENLKERIDTQPENDKHKVAVKPEADDKATKKSSAKDTNKEQKSKTEELKKKIEEGQAKQNAPILIDNTEAGIRLTMQNLRFKADKAELLPGEEKRLDQIAELLKLADGAQFLIEGHTADTGYEAGELMLSKERAFSIAAELAKRGIDKDRFICKGSGSKKPVASNDTEEGKAKNRRVEITILE